MRFISLHCDYIKFKPIKKALKSVELKKEEFEEKKVNEALVILTAIEKGDSIKTVKKFTDNIEEIANQVKVKKIVLYPYAHLSSNLSSPDNAIKILEESEKELKKKFEVVRAPFGYYKEFELKCKGHPLAELSREIKTEILEKQEDFDYKHLLREISRTKLDTSKLKDNDHRILGQRLDLFSFHESAPGMVFWHQKGLIIFNEIVNFWREEHEKARYIEISTPQIMDEKLWKISGHWQNYKNAMFLTEYEKRVFAVKPMNCPGAILVYKSKVRSYKELPLRMAELGVVHRKELSGVLAGLFRLIRFTQDDAHIFCKEKQLEKEVENILKLVQKFYEKFNFSYAVELSTRPEKFLGEKKIWDSAEKILENVLKKQKIKYKLEKGKGAFYGPKIDFNIKDSLNRSWQLATIQLDFQMPERFDLTFINENNKEEKPIILHRTIYGALERFIGILLEHTSGNLPLWIAPVQVKVLSFTDRNTKTAEKVAENLISTGIRTEMDLENETVNNKVREASMQKIPYIVLIGDKEESSKTLAVRTQDGKVKYGVKIDDFVRDIKKMIDERK